MQVIRDTTVEITSISNPLRRKIIRDSKRRGSRGLSFSFVRPAGRTHLEVQVLYTPDRGKC
jgi:hypothetical protein